MVLFFIYCYVQIIILAPNRCNLYIPRIKLRLIIRNIKVNMVMAILTMLQRLGDNFGSYCYACFFSYFVGTVLILDL